MCMNLHSFQPHEMIEQITAFQRQKSEIKVKMSQLSLLKLDASSIEAVKHLKGNILIFSELLIYTVSQPCGPIQSHSLHSLSQLLYRPTLTIKSLDKCGRKKVPFLDTFNQM